MDSETREGVKYILEIYIDENGRVAVHEMARGVDRKNLRAIVSILEEYKTRFINILLSNEVEVNAKDIKKV